MIAAEAPTDVVVNGTPGSNCALMLDFGDGARSTHVVSDAAPFPLRVTHTYPKLADVTVRVAGVANGASPACDGALDAAVHVSPAGSKIEWITLSSGCPEGWSMVGAINADKSFKCTPISDASAPTNLIHCLDGMKYFARSGFIGCAHPGAPGPDAVGTATVPAKKGKGAVKSTATPKASLPKTVTKPAAKPAAETPVPKAAL
ncbi:MAG: hypothetical protein ABIS68_02490 [Casimicrobiaceae bacterium]